MSVFFLFLLNKTLENGISIFFQYFFTITSWMFKINQVGVVASQKIHRKAALHESVHRLSVLFTEKDPVKKVWCTGGEPAAGTGSENKKSRRMRFKSNWRRSRTDRNASAIISFLMYLHSYWPKWPKTRICLCSDCKCTVNGRWRPGPDIWCLHLKPQNIGC